MTESLPLLQENTYDCESLENSCTPLVWCSANTYPCLTGCDGCYTPCVCFFSTCRGWIQWVSLVANLSMITACSDCSCDSNMQLIFGALGTAFCAQYLMCFCCSSFRATYGFETPPKMTEKYSHDKSGNGTLDFTPPKFHYISTTASCITTALFFSNFVLGAYCAALSE